LAVHAAESKPGQVEDTGCDPCMLLTGWVAPTPKNSVTHCCFSTPGAAMVWVTGAVPVPAGSSPAVPTLFGARL
jgi:hypothetical protein